MTESETCCESPERKRNMTETANGIERKMKSANASNGPNCVILTSYLDHIQSLHARN
jgi:hypothetical protein